MSRRRSQDPHLSQALRMLRLRSGKSLAEVAPGVGVSQQSLSRWETAGASVPDDKLALYLRAIDSTPDDLERELNMVSEDGPRQPQTWEALTAGLEAYAVSDETMAPWCEPGERVFAERGRHPKRLEGCVAELADGRRLIRLYERGDDDVVVLRRVNPSVSETYATGDILALHRIVWRGG